MNRALKLFFLSILIFLTVALIIFLFAFEKNFKDNIKNGANYTNFGQNIILPANQSDENSSSSISINNHKFYVEVETTPEKQALGLSNRTSMPQNDGMLFIFTEPGLYPFWMNKMLFALDFVWIKGNEVVDITENVPPPLNGNPVITIDPKSEVDKVLEINAGQIKKNGIKIGQKIIFNIN